MGYPMTYQRVLHRNNLATGDYSRSPDSTRPEDIAHRLQLILGDLRRLEIDALDENALAQEISFRTNIDIEMVTAVLREFLRI